MTYTSEAEQALYLRQAFEIAQRLPFIEVMFWHNLNACPACDAEACFFSMIDAAGDLRPAYAAYAEFPKAS